MDVTSTNVFRAATVMFGLVLTPLGAAAQTLDARPERPASSSPGEATEPDGSEGVDLELAQAPAGPLQPRAVTPTRPATGLGATPAVRPPATAAPTGPGSLAAARAAASASAPGLLDVGGTNFVPIMLGDQPPPSVLLSLFPDVPAEAVRQFPSVPVTAAATQPGLGEPPEPPVPPRPPNLQRFRRAIVPSARAVKVAVNQSPRPQDRVFFTFNYFGDLNGSLNRRLGGAITSMHVYQETFGFEKTFLDGDASLGLRLPLNTLVVNSAFNGLRGTSTAFGSLSIFGKYVLWQDQATGSVVSTGMMLSTPTGPAQFAGSSASTGIRDTLFQPFLGVYLARDRFYIQGFSAIEVPSDARDVTMYYNDLGVGYYLFKNEDPTALIAAVAPTFEVHINNPLNHRGALKANDPFGTPDIVDLTYGGNVFFGRRSVLSLAVVTPVTGPRPFAYEFLALLNFSFGRTRAGQPVPPIPPVF